MTEQKKDVIHVVISSLTEPPYAERHVRWCERAVESALLDYCPVVWFELPRHIKWTIL